MTFLVTLIALLIERFFDWSHIRNWQWYRYWQRQVIQRLPGKPSYLVLAAMVLPISLLVLLLQFILKDWMYGFVEFWFQLFILIYCFGPQNLWADTFACINALTQGDPQLAANKLKRAFGMTESRPVPSSHKQLLHHIFIESNRRIFAVLFWFIVFGPLGAVLYRTLSLSVPPEFEEPEVSVIAQNARLAENIADWLPVRILTFIFALGGHFVEVMTRWRKHLFMGVDKNETLLIECGMAALHVEHKKVLPKDGSAEKHAISLIDRSLIIVLIVIGFGVMIF